MNSELSADKGVESLFKLYVSDVYRFARYLAPNDVDPTDVVQEVFLRAFKSWSVLQKASNHKAWLLQTTRNYVFDLLRKQRVETNYKKTHTPDISKVSVGLDTLVELEDAVSQLKPNYRQVFVLRCVQDMTIKETAEILGWSQSKVKTSLYRSIEQLRSILGAERLDSPKDYKKVGERNEH